MGSIPGLGTKIPRAAWCSQKQKMGDTERICTQEPHRVPLSFKTRRGAEGEGSLDWVYRRKMTNVICGFNRDQLHWWALLFVPLTFSSFLQGFSFGVRWKKSTSLVSPFDCVREGTFWLFSWWPDMRDLSTLSPCSFPIGVATLVRFPSKLSKWKPRRAHMDHMVPNKFLPYPKM